MGTELHFTSQEVCTDLIDRLSKQAFHAMQKKCAETVPANTETRPSTDGADIWSEGPGRGTARKFVRLAWRRVETMPLRHQANRPATA